MVQSIIDNFHKLYYNSLVWDKNTTWMGVRTEKCPLDLWIYQEIIFRTKPNLIIETGTLEGGTTLFLSQILRLIKEPIASRRVLTIDLNEREFEFVSNIHMLVGDSVSPDIIEVVEKVYIKSFNLQEDSRMVILDSDHSYPHVLKELELYSKFVTPGCYLIVEDTNLNGNPVVKDYGPGPMEAVKEFLKTNKNFEADLECEKFFMTFNPKGYLKKIK